MTCQVVIRGPNGSTAQARALLASGSETSHRRGPMITCIGKTTPNIRPKGLVNIQVTDIHQKGKAHSVRALVFAEDYYQ